MGRLIFFLLLFSAALNPDLRARAQPYVQWMLDPVFEWSARSKVGEISRTLAAEASAGRPIPTSATLPAFLRNQYKREDAALDPWNVPYFVSGDSHMVRVASAGPDQQRHTDDDIVSPPVAAREP